MDYYSQIGAATLYIQQQYTDTFPKQVIVTGTGLSSIADVLDVHCEIPYADIPQFPRSTVESHRGSLLIGSIGGSTVAVLAGRWHYYEGYTSKEITLPIRTMRRLGCESVLFTNVAGGVNPTYEAGDVVLIRDHINMIPDSPLRGPNDDRLGLRFPDMLHTYSSTMLHELEGSAAALGIKTARGVYLALPGPSLETPAEYTMIYRLGGDLVGMSTVPEVIAARHAGLKVAAISVVSNVCYPPERITETTIEDVIRVANVGSGKVTAILENMLSRSKQSS